jgi:hypothetical protein
MMNQYGTRAKQHWQKYLPERFSQLEDPDNFFSNLGEQIAERVQSLAEALAGNDPPGETYLDKVGRLNMARRDAESDVLREMALLEPESRPPKS